MSGSLISRLRRSQSGCSRCRCFLEPFLLLVEVFLLDRIGWVRLLRPWFLIQCFCHSSVNRLCHSLSGLNSHFSTDTTLTLPRLKFKPSAAEHVFGQRQFMKGAAASSPAAQPSSRQQPGTRPPRPFAFHELALVFGCLRLRPAERFVLGLLFIGPGAARSYGPLPGQHLGFYLRSVARRELTPHLSLSRIRQTTDEDEREHEPFHPFQRGGGGAVAYVLVTQEGA